MTAAAVHAVLIVSAFAYTWLRPQGAGLEIAVIVLQLAQGMYVRTTNFQIIIISFLCTGTVLHAIWLVMTQYISALLWTEEDQRMAQVSKLSALYSCIGPAVGALAAGFFVSGSDTLLTGFTTIYRSTVAITAASFVVSWGWSTSN